MVLAPVAHRLARLLAPLALAAGLVAPAQAQDFWGRTCPPVQPGGDLVGIALGDSLTNDGLDHDWPNLLDQLDQVTWLNAGAAGRITEHFLEGVEDPAFGASIWDTYLQYAFPVDIAVVYLGVNDRGQGKSLQDYAMSLQLLVTQLKENCLAHEVWFILPPDFPGVDIDNASWRGAIKRIGSIARSRTMDLSPHWNHDVHTGPDMLHNTAEGHFLIYQLVLAHLLDWSGGGEE